MRRSGWILPGVAIAVWTAAVGWPVIALVPVLVAGPSVSAKVRHAAELFATSFVWALAIALAAVVVGWVPGRLLGRTQAGRGFLPLSALILAPICVPAYVVFYAWWQSWPADSALYGWAVQNGHVQLTKSVTLFVGLLCWSWPVAAWCVAGFAAAVGAHRQEMLQLDGAGSVRRIIEAARSEWRGLALGGLIVFLFIFNNTTAFDIAQIFTFGYELRVFDSELGAGPGAILRAAAPAIVVAVIGTALAWSLLGRCFTENALRPPQPTRGAVITTAVIWLTSVVLPMVLFVANLTAGASVAVFVDLYGRDLANTVAMAVASGLVTVVVVVGLAAAWQDHRRWVRVVADAQAIGWLLAAVVPATTVGVALEAAYNRPGLDAMVYGKPTILVLGYLARFGFVAALLARWASLSEPRALGDLRRLDGADTLVGYVVAAWPRLVAAAGAAAAVVGVLSMSELVVAARLAPPRFPLIAGAILNAVHYQRPDTVLLAVLGLIGSALAVTLVVVVVFQPLRRGGRLGVMLAAGTLVALGSGCGSGEADREPSPLETRLIFGSSGRSLGQFQYPRGIAVDRQHRVLFVVDKSARVQRWGFDGRPQVQWQMPKWDNGKPTGLGVSPDGRVFVADTHYHRVIAFDAQGRELMRFGSYGSGPGEFIYPTDVAFGPEGRIYVSEYGGNERIGVFDSEGEFLFAFGEPGAGPGQYNRPQSMAFSADLSELFIADACNHRIVVVTPAGEPLRVIGTAGRGQGELAYPYDVCVLDDGTLLVCEFGNNRIQRFSPDGHSRGLYGRVGTDDGELQYPWGIDAAGETIFVLDSGNNRVQVLGREAVSQ